MSNQILSVDAGSPAERAGIMAGDQLLRINGHEIIDVLDYRFYGYDPVVRIGLRDASGALKSMKVKKREGEELGLNFSSYLMDDPKPCANHCLFCFVDQMAPNCRDTLYFKDDDARLSFLMGNYITLTNLSPREAQRIIDLKISPINVSVHATDPKLHRVLLGNKQADIALDYMKAFAEAGIQMNGQIVVCPGYNDGEQLQKTMEDVAAMHFASCSVVPVGLTKYREGLPKIQPVDREKAIEVVEQVEAFAQTCLETMGTRLFFCSDEFYIRAGKELPEEDYYEGYVQIENGVGMLRSLMEEFRRDLEQMEDAPKPSPFTIATGISAKPFLETLLREAQEKFPAIQGKVIAIENDFLGHTIDVAGLITGKDLMRQAKGKILGSRLLIPVNMLRHGGDVFLDDVHIPEIEQELGVTVRVVEQDGHDLFRAMKED